MLETASARLSAPGGPHFGSPDKDPARRLATLEAAGRARVPFTTGILIGIGETRRERIEALLAIREQHERYGHIQEIIIQNFRAKPGTRMGFDAESREMKVLGLNPGVSREQVEDNTGFKLLFEARLEKISPPGQQELAVLRELDPERLYTA